MLERTNHIKKLDICQWFCVPFCVRKVPPGCLVDKLNKSHTLLYERSKRNKKGKRRKACSEEIFFDYYVLNQSVILMYHFSSHQNKSFILHNSILHIMEFTLGNSRKYSKTNLKIA